MAKMPERITIQIEYVDLKVVEWLADDLGWPFQFCDTRVPERYIEPVAAHYQAKEGIETLQEWIDAIQAELAGSDGSDA